MIAKVRCIKCGENGRFDVGSDVTTVEQAQAKVDADKRESCPFGKHVELQPIEYEVLEVVEGEALTLDEWKAEMIGKGYDLWTTEELTESEIEITSFAYGMPFANVRGEDFHIDFTSAPDNQRFYYARAGSYAKAIDAA